MEEPNSTNTGRPPSILRSETPPWFGLIPWSSSTSAPPQAAALDLPCFPSAAMPMLPESDDSSEEEEEDRVAGEVQ